MVLSDAGRPASSSSVKDEVERESRGNLGLFLRRKKTRSVEVMAGWRHKGGSAAD